MPKIKMSNQTILELTVIGIIIMVLSGCSFPKGQNNQNQNTWIASAIYSQTKYYKVGARACKPYTSKHQKPY